MHNISKPKTLLIYIKLMLNSTFLSESGLTQLSQYPVGA